eukprot:7008507-Alexandrium_andersonii.AAC.1
MQPARSSFSHTNIQGFRGLRIGGLRIEVRYTAIPGLQTPSIQICGGRTQFCARNDAERTPQELRAPISRPLGGSPRRGASS